MEKYYIYLGPYSNPPRGLLLKKSSTNGRYITVTDHNSDQAWIVMADESSVELKL